MDISPIVRLVGLSLGSIDEVVPPLRSHGVPIRMHTSHKVAFDAFRCDGSPTDYTDLGAQRAGVTKSACRPYRPLSGGNP